MKFYILSKENIKEKDRPQFIWAYSKWKEIIRKVIAHFSIISFHNLLTISFICFCDTFFLSTYHGLGTEYTTVNREIYSPLRI